MSTRRDRARTLRSILTGALLLSGASCGHSPSTHDTWATPGPPDGPVPVSVTIEGGSGGVPPPGNFDYTIRAAVRSHAIDVSLRLTYRMREQISEADLRRQGFSPDDDVSWRGTLGASWRDELVAIARAPLEELDPMMTGGVPPRITARDADGDVRKGILEHREPVDRFVGELVLLGRHELGRAPAPVLRYAVVQAGASPVILTVTLAPRPRTAALTLTRGTDPPRACGAIDIAAWHALGANVIYSGPVRRELPVRAGAFIDRGVGDWLDARAQVEDPLGGRGNAAALRERYEALLARCTHAVR